MVRPSELFKSTIPSFGTVSLKREGAKEYSDRMIEKNGDPLLDAIKFISGGEKLGTSIVANAKNNIVNFNRANILPKQQNLESLISNISSNTFNNATNIYNNAPNQAIRKEDKDSKSKLNLKFISEFIKFFGSKDVEKSLKKNLKLVRNSLVETFDVAVLLRKAIKKIADELKNISLSGFGGGGGGSLLGLLGNLIGGLGAGAGAASLLGRRGQVPAGTQLRPPTNTRMPKLGGRIGLGLAALGLGAGAVSALDQPEVPSAQPAMNINELVLQKFNSILDRFDKAIDSLARGKEKPGKQAQKPSAPGAAPATIGNRSPGTADMNPADLGKVTDAVQDPNVKAFLDTLANVESGGKYDVSVGGATFSDMSKHPEMYNPKLDSDAAGRYQFISTTFKPIAQRLGLKDFSPQSQDLAAVQYLEDLGVLDEIQSGDPQKIQIVIDRLKGSKWTGLKKYGEGQGVEFFLKRKKMYEGQVKPQTSNPKVQLKSDANTKADLIGATEPPVTPSLVNPSIPKPESKNLQVAIVPFDAGQSQVQPAPVASKAVNLSGSSNNGPKIAFLSSKNSDSYSGLSAKMIYNIV